MSALPHPRRRTLRARVLAGIVTVAALGAPLAVAAAPAQAAGDDWLHVQGNKIVDKAGTEVWLTGANWFGFNATERVFHGLWSVNLEDVTKSMADHGINIVRVPISTPAAARVEGRQGGALGRREHLRQPGPDGEDHP